MDCRWCTIYKRNFNGLFFTACSPSTPIRRGRAWSQVSLTVLKVIENGSQRATDHEHPPFFSGLRQEAGWGLLYKSQWGYKCPSVRFIEVFRIIEVSQYSAVQVWFHISVVIQINPPPGILLIRPGKWPCSGGLFAPRADKSSTFNDMTIEVYI